jgi:hypothetical protein
LFSCDLAEDENQKTVAVGIFEGITSCLIWHGDLSNRLIWSVEILEDKNFEWMSVSWVTWQAHSVQICNLVREITERNRFFVDEWLSDEFPNHWTGFRWTLNGENVFSSSRKGVTRTWECFRDILVRPEGGQILELGNARNREEENQAFIGKTQEEIQIRCFETHQLLGRVHWILDDILETVNGHNGIENQSRDSINFGKFRWLTFKSQAIVIYWKRLEQIKLTMIK